MLTKFKSLIIIKILLTMTKKPNIYHPGKILREEFLNQIKITPHQLANNINASEKELKDIIAERKDLDKNIATRLALYFHTAPTFWINLQSNYDEEQVNKVYYKNLKKEIQPLLKPQTNHSHKRLYNN